MDLIKQMADIFVMLIRAGAAMRLVYCLIRMGTSDEESSMYKKRARNTIVFYVLAESIWQLKDLVLGYYG